MSKGKVVLSVIVLVLVVLGIIGFTVVQRGIDSRFNRDIGGVERVEEAPARQVKSSGGTEDSSSVSVPEELLPLVDLLSIRDKDFDSWYSSAKSFVADGLNSSIGLNSYYEAYKGIMPKHELGTTYIASVNLTPYKTDFKITDYSKLSPTDYSVTGTLVVTSGKDVIDEVKDFTVSIEDGKLTRIDGWFVDMLKATKGVSKEEFTSNNGSFVTRLPQIDDSNLKSNVQSYLTGFLDEAKSSYNGHLDTAYVNGKFVNSNLMTVMSFYSAVNGSGQYPENNSVDWSSLVLEGSPDNYSYRFFVLKEDGSVKARVGGSVVGGSFSISNVELAGR